MIEEFKTIVKRSISNTVSENNNPNSLTLWEVIKGNVRNEELKFSVKRKEKIQRQKDIKNIEENLTVTDDLNTLKQELEVKRTQLNFLYEKKGLMVKTKAKTLKEMKRTHDILQI